MGIKTAFGTATLILLVVIAWVALFGNDAQAPIVDPTCEPGYELVGEGCILAKDACELQGDAYRFDETTGACTNDQAFTPESMQVSIALLDTSGEGEGKSRGCDTVNMVARTVPRSMTPLDAALRALFAEPEGEVGGEAYNFIARTNSTLRFERATITSGTANIYLSGRLTGLAGVCDDPRAGIQIEETALQFPSVQRVQLYLNDEPTDLTPSQQ